MYCGYSNVVPAEVLSHVQGLCMVDMLVKGNHHNMSMQL